MKGSREASRSEGQSLIEVISGLVLIFSIVLALTDLGAVIYAAALNDTTCRNAANAAAVGPPGEADHRAQVVVARANSGGFSAAFAHFVLITPVGVGITARPSLQVDTDTGQTFCPGGMVSGTVEVTTEVEVRPFVLGTVCRGKAPFVFRSTQTFPIRYMQPAGIAPSNGR
jgi:hypothetical protein